MYTSYRTRSLVSNLDHALLHSFRLHDHVVSCSNVLETNIFGLLPTFAICLAEKSIDIFSNYCCHIHRS